MRRCTVSTGTPYQGPGLGTDPTLASLLTSPCSSCDPLLLLLLLSGGALAGGLEAGVPAQGVSSCCLGLSSASASQA